MKIVKGIGWLGTYALTVEFAAKDVLSEATPVEVAIIYVDHRPAYTGQLIEIENQVLIFQDGTRIDIEDVEIFELTD